MVGITAGIIQGFLANRGNIGMVLGNFHHVGSKYQYHPSFSFAQPGLGSGDSLGKSPKLLTLKGTTHSETCVRFRYCAVPGRVYM